MGNEKKTSYDNATGNDYRWIQNIENAMNNDLHNKELKRTVSVMLCDPPCKDFNARFTTVPLKALFQIYSTLHSSLDNCGQMIING